MPILPLVWRQQMPTSVLKYSRSTKKNNDTVDSTPLNNFRSSFKAFQYGLIQKLRNAKL